MIIGLHHHHLAIQLIHHPPLETEARHLGPRRPRRVGDAQSSETARGARPRGGLSRASAALKGGAFRVASKSVSWRGLRGFGIIKKNLLEMCLWPSWRPAPGCTSEGEEGVQEETSH